MKTPMEIMAEPALRLLENWRPATDEKTVAERKWQSGLKPNADQKPCDHGLFGDEHLQAELFKGGAR